MAKSSGNYLFDGAADVVAADVGVVRKCITASASAFALAAALILDYVRQSPPADLDLGYLEDDGDTLPRAALDQPARAFLVELATELFSDADCGEIAVTIPIGSILPYAGDTVPAGFLKCDGATVSRTTYAALFAIVGERYGAADGITTFQVPDLRGRVVGAAGQPAGSPTNWAAGVMSGTEQVTLSTNQMPAHAHVLSPLAAGSGAAYVANAGNYVGHGNDVPFNDIQSFSAGGNEPHNNVQPTTFVDMFIIAAGI